MSITNSCLNCLASQDWNKLNSIISDNKNHIELNSDPTFQVFERHLVSEIKKLSQLEELDSPKLVLVNIFRFSAKLKLLNLSDGCILEIADFLFSHYPSEEYAELLTENNEAKLFLQRKNEEKADSIINNRIAANLNVKIGKNNELLFTKVIFNSPQEKELFEVASSIYPEKLLLPNVALSTIINSKILDQLKQEEKEFFFRSTLDLCIVNRNSFLPEFFIELDSSWHDIPKQEINDSRKDNIFLKAGVKLIRLRKRQNMEMKDIFELVLKKHAS